MDYSPYCFFFFKTVLLKLASSAVTFAVVVLCCLATILFNVHRSPSVEFGFRPLFLFADGVLPCFVYVITMDTIARETLNSYAVFVTDAPANGVREIAHFTACFNSRRTKRIIHWGITYKTWHVNCAIRARRIIYTEAVLPICINYCCLIILSNPYILVFERIIIRYFRIPSMKNCHHVKNVYVTFSKLSTIKQRTLNQYIYWILKHT